MKVFRETRQESAFNLLVHIWTKALFERFRVPPPRMQVGVIDLMCVVAITVMGGLGTVPATVLSEVYNYVRRPTPSLTRDQEDALRLLARGWIELLRGYLRHRQGGGFRWTDGFSHGTALPDGCDSPMKIPEIRVPAVVLANSIGADPTVLLEVLIQHRTYLYGAAISFGPKK